MGFFSRFIPKPKQTPIKNNVPKEKKHIKKSFLAYCHKHHDTEGDKLCPKCTALLAAVMVKMNKCMYGITKPICDKCDKPCFGAAQTKEFLKIMKGASNFMMFRHPIMALKHKLQSMGVDYAKYKQSQKK
ncbi:MAG: nitrous oxide-stimulated promoter family protein [Selenomonadaceae bacterium]|nr:nitrous oxide-stimulated promoter family protein [Selenomonadaceae bacterium]MBP3722333.1 nitrous oxide-stimulated promoter family protein [Selenomonadaceae bacterium]